MSDATPPPPRPPTQDHRLLTFASLHTLALALLQPSFPLSLAAMMARRSAPAPIVLPQESVDGTHIVVPPTCPPRPGCPQSQFGFLKMARKMASVVKTARTRTVLARVRQYGLSLDSLRPRYSMNDTLSECKQGVCVSILKKVC